jgi:hypothetical protein
MEDLTKSTFERRKEAPLWYYNMSIKWYLTAAVSWQAFKENKNAKLAIEELNISSDEVVFMMESVKSCFGNSLELICKACALKHGYELKKIHFVHQIAKKFDIYNERELKELEYISEFIAWAERYPTSNTDKHYSKVFELDDMLYSESIGRFKHKKDDFDWDKFNELWSKADTYFLSLPEISNS